MFDNTCKKESSGSDALPMKIDLVVTWEEYRILYRYALDNNCDSLVSGIRRMIQKEGELQNGD